MPSKFQDKIRVRFQNYVEKTESVRVLAQPGNVQLSNEVMQLYSKASVQKNHEFSCEDGVYTVNLSRTFVSLSATSYKNWGDFRQQLEFVISAFAPRT
jgi:uncharacterized protein (TIGR04255 family)